MTWPEVLTTLAVWKANPAIFADPGVIEPFSDYALRIATIRAEMGHTCNDPPPTNMVADPNGGIVMRWEDGRGSREWHVDEEGHVYEAVVR
jgi:hypothetical protein